MYSLKNIAANAYSCIKNADKKGLLDDQQLLSITQKVVEEAAFALEASGDLAKEQAKEQMQAAMETLNAAESELGEDIVGIMHLIRISGILPYYTCKAIACYFADKVLDNEIGEVSAYVAKNGIKQAVIRFCGFTFEAEVVQLIAKQFEAIIDEGRIAEDDKKIDILKEAYRAGYHYEKVYKGCAQCTLAAMFDVTGKKEETLFRAANGFASGMGLFGDGSCGGYSGGLLFLGTYVGRRLEFFGGDKEEKDMSYKVSEKLHKRFIETYGSVICHDIHRDIFGRAFHIRDAKEKDAFEEAGAHSMDKCTAVVATSAMWTAEILMEENLI